MNYELFLQGPNVYIPLIFVSLITTSIAYGIFPVLFATKRQKPITNKRYLTFCYGINFLVMIAFQVLGSESSGGPYILWTTIFCSIGKKSLKQRGMFLTQATVKSTLRDSAQPKPREGNSCVEDGINLFYPGGKNILGRVEITNAELVIYKKGVFIRSLLGVVGSSLVEGKEILRIPHSKVVSFKKEKFRLNSNACHVTLTDGSTYILIFDHPEKSIPCLSEAIVQATDTPSLGRTQPMGAAVTAKSVAERMQNPTEKSIIVEKTSERECKHCGKPLLADAEFCLYCGNKIAEENPESTTDVPICSQCGQELIMEARFCPYCGHQCVNTKEPQIKKDEAQPTKKNIRPILAVTAILVAAMAFFGTVLNNQESIKSQPAFDQVLENEDFDVPISSVNVRVVTFDDKFTATFVLAKFKSGPTTETHIIELMQEYGGFNNDGTLQTIKPGEFVEELDVWCFDRNRRAGDIEVIENNYGFSLCYVSAVNRDQAYYEGEDIGPLTSALLRRMAEAQEKKLEENYGTSSYKELYERQQK